MPATEQFAQQLRVNKMTVQRALSALAQEGLVVRRCSRGTYVTDSRKPPLIPGRTLRLAILWVRSSTPHHFDRGFDGDMWQGALAQWGVDCAPEFTLRDGATQAIWREPARGLVVECVGGLLGQANRRPDFDAVAKGNYDGLLTLGIIDDEWLKRVLDLGVPTVLADYPGDAHAARADQVFVDPLSGYRAAVRYFIAQGMKRIHFVGNTRRQSNTVDPDSLLRMSAYQQALAQHGLKTPENSIHFELSSPGRFVELGKRLAALPETERPEAAICHEVGDAEALIDVFEGHGLKLSGAGAASQSHYGSALPIRIDGREVGRIAADLLISRLRQSNRPLLNVGVRMTFQTMEQPAPAPEKEARA